MGSCKVLRNTQGETWQHSATQRNPDKSVTDRAVPHGNKHPPSSATADTEMPPCCPLGSSAPPQHLRHDSKCFFFPVSPGTCDQPSRSHLSEFIQFLLQVKNLKYAQPHSSEGHQDQQRTSRGSRRSSFPCCSVAFCSGRVPVVGKEPRGVPGGRKHLHQHSRPPKRSGGTRSSSSAAWPGAGWAGHAWCALPCGTRNLPGWAQPEPWGQPQLCPGTAASLQRRIPSSDAATLKASSIKSLTHQHQTSFRPGLADHDPPAPPTAPSRDTRGLRCRPGLSNPTP